MSILNRIYLAIVFLLFTAVSPAFAQSALTEFGSPVESKGRNALARIKAEISFLLKENKQLELQFEMLQREYQSLYKKVDLDSTKFERTYRSAMASREKHALYKQKAEDFREQVAGKQNKALIYKTRISYLKGIKLDVEEKENLLTLKMAALDKEKRELELEVELKEQLQLSKHNQSESEIERLKTRLMALLEKEKEYVQKISELDEQRVEIPGKVAVLTEQIEALKIDVAIADKKRALLVRENDIMKKKRLLLQRRSEEMLSKKRDERESLMNIVGQLQSEHDSLDSSLKNSLAKKHDKKRLMDDFIKIDKKNQDLRSKITELKTQIKEFDDSF